MCSKNIHLLCLIYRYKSQLLLEHLIQSCSIQHILFLIRQTSLSIRYIKIYMLFWTSTSQMYNALCFMIYALIINKYHYIDICMNRNNYNISIFMVMHIVNKKCISTHADLWKFHNRIHIYIYIFLYRYCQKEM